MSRSSHLYPHPLSFGWFVNPSSHHPNQMCIIMILLITINNLICMPIEALSSTLEISVLIFSSSCSTSASLFSASTSTSSSLLSSNCCRKKIRGFPLELPFFLNKKKEALSLPHRRGLLHTGWHVFCVS